MAVSNPPIVLKSIDQVNNDQLNPLKRKKPSDSPETSPQKVEMDVEEDTQGRKCIGIMCGGRSAKLILDKFYKLEGNKGYAKCIEYNGKLISPQEFEAIAGMKAMKSWKKSIKHKSQPLLTYLTSGTLKDNLQAPTDIVDASSVTQSMNLAFRELESRLLSSLQEVITSSVGSLKASFETEIKSLHAKVHELSERIKLLEEDRPNLETPMLSMDDLQPKMESVVTSTVKSLLSEEKEKDKRKLNLIFHRIPESTAEEALERRAHDTDHVKTIIQTYLKVDAQVDTIVRIGKKDPNKTRLLKVDVLSEKMKKLILRNSPQLREESNPDWVKKVFITPDLTPKEQEENKALREKLTELNKTAPRSYRIKNGQIVRRDGHPPST